MANPTDTVIADDIYGGRMRLNPNADDRSYATRRFRVRLEPGWAEGSGDDAPFDDVDSPVGKERRAILAAVGSDYVHPYLPGLAIQDITATQVGPNDFDVQADYFRIEGGSTGGAAKSVQVTTRASSVPVYRTQFNDAGSSLFADGLPNGNFAGLGNGQFLPRGANYESWKYEWPVTEALVQISAELNYVTYATLFGSTAAMSKVNYYNSNIYTYDTITFAANTLKFIGLSTNSSIVGGNRTYSVSYTYLWRPGGWYAQKLTTIGATAGYFTTVTAPSSYPRVAFNLTLFPDS